MKERLTGAIILVALIVLLVPELLTGPVRSTSTAQPGATTGSSGEPPLRSYTIDLADDARTATASAASPRSSVGSNGSVPDPASTAAAEAKPPSISEGPAQPAAETSSAGVQPGEEAAPAPEAKVVQPTTERPVPIPQPVKPQVALPTPRTGPPEKRLSTGAAPRTSAPAAHAAATPAPTAGGWLVQLGVFASRANADRLVEELKGKGFKVSVSEVTNKGKTLYRVHTAALTDRAAAQDLAAKLHAVGASSAVMPRT